MWLVGMISHKLCLITRNLDPVGKGHLNAMKLVVHLSQIFDTPHGSALSYVTLPKFQVRVKRKKAGRLGSIGIVT